MKTNRPRRPRRAGFTLMEVLLVLVIIVILGSLAVGTFANMQGKANLKAAKSQVLLFKSPLNMYHLDMNQYPTTEQGLEALLQPPSDLENPAKWQGPYIEALPPDPWGRPYEYEQPGQHNPMSFDVWSTGPDAGSTAGFIGNWEEIVE